MTLPSSTSEPKDIPRKSKRTPLVVASVFGVVLLLCGGGCILSLFYGGSSLAGFALMGSVLPLIQNDEAIIEKLGDNVQPTGMPDASSLNMNEGGRSVVEFEIAGSKSTGTVRAEVVNQAGVMKPQSIRVSTADGWSHEVELSE
jgi:hypothetical protein